ncbi:Hypothetical predicted protein [Cloeon dipterum]|uniref:Uncharacterized protein n=1 Tax=Cloeon dipterum TaxID=197152 RepID=A0A8S1CZP1_9INSE|nr:Hypothetical predicted protein [Cloeon dipterum]
MDANSALPLPRPGRGHRHFFTLSFSQRTIHSNVRWHEPFTMVLLHVKKGAESLFLYQTSCEADMKDVYYDVTSIFNGRIRIEQLCHDFEELSKHGPVMPEEMQGLAPGQADDLRLEDEWADKCEASGGWRPNPDPMGRRNGRQPSEQMERVLLDAAAEAKTAISKVQVEAKKALSVPLIAELLHLLRGATLVVYPMGLPPHDPCFLTEQMCDEFASAEILSREGISSGEAMLWFCSRHLSREGAVSKALNSSNEKTKVIVKITGASKGPPSKEVAITEEDQLKMMQHFRHRQDQLQVGPEIPSPPTRLTNRLTN